MDALISAALAEICPHGTAGVSLSALWPALNPGPAPSVKPALWTTLLSVPTLQFSIPGEPTPLSPGDPRIQRVEDAEKLNLKVVASKEMRNCFLGVYDDNNLSDIQEKALELICSTREKGYPQHHLAEKLGKGKTDFFYVAKNLEVRRLIVKQDLVVKPKNSGDNNNASSTSLIHLTRYAKHLGDHQRFEINEEDLDYENLSAVPSSDKMVVRDFLPAMKAVCDKLEEANNKVLVVSDVKKVLGYTGNTGHRAWRNIRDRLVDAGLVQVFNAKVNAKAEPCLCLVKNFSPKNVDCEKGQEVKFGRTFKKIDQLFEYPIDLQIYDLIDAEGTKGAILMEVCRRLGVSNKKSDKWIDCLLSRVEMHLQMEDLKKTKAKRYWTFRNYNPKASSALLGTSNMDVGVLDCSEGSAVAFLEYHHEATEADFATNGKPNNKETDTESPQGLPKNGETDHMIQCPGSVSEVSHEPTVTPSDCEISPVTAEVETNSAPPEMTPLTLLKLPDPGARKMYPHLPLTAKGVLREQRILARLKDEKFILRQELFNWLVSLEEDRQTTTDRKTVDRILNKLQQEGHCKCVNINLPNVTNCGRNKLIKVVLQPSVQSFPPEMMGEIHDRLRSLNKQTHGPGSSRKTNESVPKLDGVTRAQVHAGSGDKVNKSEAMRANGYVLAKMVRAKLLHGYFWSYLRSLPGWDDVLSSGSYGCTYKLFELEAALKDIPVELFFQVAGSTQKLDDMMEKCRSGLCLSDLPTEDYKRLMDTNATARLSLIIDILRRLKLIRMVRDVNSNDGLNVSHATSTHAMELKPYIEEPLSVGFTSDLISLDLRPRIRHDFILSDKEAVDEYWNTLEFCYASANQEAATYAFPGSSVPEVFSGRSWASIRVMSADQRSELLKRIANFDLSKNISYKECAKIAEDLNLSSTQVLAVCYDKRRQMFNRSQDVGNSNEKDQPSKRKRSSSSKKRKKPLEPTMVKCAAVDFVDEGVGEQGLTKLPDISGQFMEVPDFPPGDHRDCFPVLPEDDNQETSKEPGPIDDEECHSIRECALQKMKPVRQSRFLWTDEADRQLIIQYARHHAVLGVKIRRTDWDTVPDLPAPSRTCLRRMALLTRNSKFRKALMKLCTILSERYAGHLEKTKNISVRNNGCGGLVRCLRSESLKRKLSDAAEQHEEQVLEEEPWDDFADKTIKKAFGEVLLCKQMVKLDTSERVGSVPSQWRASNNNTDGRNHLESEPDSSNIGNEDVWDLGLGSREDSARRSRHHHLNEKFAKLLNKGPTVSGQVHRSLAVSSAVELLKLVFLSNSTTPQLQNLLAETLRRYSEHDLFAAFSYLRDNKIMIGGDGGPFVLSQQFLHCFSKSPFPANTGKRATEFSCWLHEREKDLIEGGINLSADLQCGDILQLFALVYSGELSISACMPDEGVGEAEDLRKLKRKAEDEQFCENDKAKRLKSLADSDYNSRRQKGFPGIVLSVRRATVSTADAVELFKDGGTCMDKLQWDDKINAVLGPKTNCASSSSDFMEEIPNFDVIVPTARWSTKSTWEAIVCHAEYTMGKPSDPSEAAILSPKVFEVVYAAIQRAGDQGLSMEEIAQLVDMPGKDMPECIIDALQDFGRVLKVNAYESVRIVDVLYRSKYFLTPLPGFQQDAKTHSAKKSPDRSGDRNLIFQPEDHGELCVNSQKKDSVNNRDVHQVTILNLPVNSMPSNENKSIDGHEGLKPDKLVLPVQCTECETYKLSASDLRMPIFPWINGDGTINRVVYNALVRRVLGTVMQNPGMLEEDIICRINVLNPQSCRSLLELMILDKHLIVRKMHQSTSRGPPALLGTLLGNSSSDSKSVYRNHYFANPMSASLL